MKVLNQQIKKQRIKELALEKAEFRNGLVKIAIIIIAVMALSYAINYWLPNAPVWTVNS